MSTSTFQITIPVAYQKNVFVKDLTPNLMTPNLSAEGLQQVRFSERTLPGSEWLGRHRVRCAA